jgi:hypothetical protein
VTASGLAARATLIGTIGGYPHITHNMETDAVPAVAVPAAGGQQRCSWAGMCFGAAAAVQCYKAGKMCKHDKCLSVDVEQSR